MAKELATPKDESHCRGGSTAPTGLSRKACGSLAPPVPAVIMRKIHLILLVLLSGLCLACQPDPSKARVERVLTASWQSYCRHFIKPTARSSSRKRAAAPSPRPRPTPCSGPCGPMTRRSLTGSMPGLIKISPGSGRTATACWPGAGAGSRTAPGGCWMPTAPPTATWITPWPWSWRHRMGWRAPPGLPDYREEARRVQADILAKEVVALPDGDLLLTPGNWHEPQPPYLVNPSYFSPAAYRLFALPQGKSSVNGPDRRGGAGTAPTTGCRGNQ